MNAEQSNLKASFADYYQSPEAHADLSVEYTLGMPSFVKHYQNPASALGKTLRLILERGGQALNAFARHYQRPYSARNRAANKRLRVFLQFGMQDIGSFAEHYQKPTRWQQMEIGTF